MNSKKRFVMLKLIMFGVIVSFVSTMGAENVSAWWYGYSGSGGTYSEYKHVKCSEAYYYRNVEVCDGGVTGGASWRIFKTSNPPVSYWTKPESTPYAAVWHDRPMSYSYFGAGYTLGAVENVCPTRYYAAYVFDGWGGNNHSDIMAYYGPIAWRAFRSKDSRKKDPGPDHYPVYNNAYAHGYSELVGLIEAGADVNGWNIYGEGPTLDTKGVYSKIGDGGIRSDSALLLYRTWNDPFATEIPYGAGWFCVDISPASSATSEIDIKVRNQSVEKYNNSDKQAGHNTYDSDKVYAKPGDELKYHTDYYPRAQAGYNWRTQNINVNGGGDWPGGIQHYSTVGAVFNNWLRSSGRGSWENAFVVNSNFAGQVGGSSGGINTDSQSNDNYHRVTGNEVGGSGLAETAVTTDNTPTSINTSFSASGYQYLLSKIGTRIDDTAKVYVPYNFNTETEIVTESKEGDPIYLNAGEQQEIDYHVKLTRKRNQITTNSGSDSEAYVTKADKVIRELVVYNSANGSPLRGGGVWEGKGRSADACSYFGLSDGNNCSRSGRRSDETLEPKNEDWQDETLTFNVQDLQAGSQVCVAVAVFPASSGADTNWNDMEYSRSWRISDSKCFTVAKKPSIQFWGGNVFSRGNLATSTAVKNNLAGYPEYAYSAKEKKGTFVFGSWGELGVVGNGSISGFGSGASMGYAFNMDGIIWPSYNPMNGLGNNALILGDPGGSDKSSFCDRIPLTIPNSPCNDNNPINGLSSAINITKAASDKESIVTLLASGDASKMANYTHYDTDETITKADYNAIGETIDGSTTRVVSSEGSITIGSDLVYLDVNGEYTSFSQMPKLIIYAKKNIYIDCRVNRIDALLIANDTVVTCNNFGNELNDNNIKEYINDAANSNQLTINGAIIAKRLIPNRTYGAATGANSIVPAEIVNFDPTLYQFGGSAESDDDTTGRLDITYIHELAPRL